MNSRQHTQQPSKRSIPAFLILTAVVFLAVLGLILTAASTRAAQDATLGQISVTTLADDFGSNAGTCSLREAITTANANFAFGGCISASGTETIALGAG